MHTSFLKPQWPVLNYQWTCFYKFLAHLPCFFPFSAATLLSVPITVNLLFLHPTVQSRTLAPSLDSPSLPHTSTLVMEKHALDLILNRRSLSSLGLHSRHSSTTTFCTSTAATQVVRFSPLSPSLVPHAVSRPLCSSTTGKPFLPSLGSSPPDSAAGSSLIIFRPVQVQSPCCLVTTV